MQPRENYLALLTALQPRAGITRQTCLFGCSPFHSSMLMSFYFSLHLFLDQLVIVCAKKSIMASRSRSIARNGTRPTTTTTTSRPQTGRSSRPRTVETSTDYIDNEIICAISESRGISPTVGLSFVNVSTSEAVLCQFTDTQTYARTCHKLAVFAPCEILYTPSATDSKLVSIIAENLEVDKANIALTKIDRKYWSDISGLDYVQELAFPSDLESLQLPIAGNYFATCCFSAVVTRSNEAIYIADNYRL